MTATTAVSTPSETRRRRSRISLRITINNSVAPTATAVPRENVSMMPPRMRREATPAASRSRLDGSRKKRISAKGRSTARTCP
jgi:hypothetical protein